MATPVYRRPRRDGGPVPGLSRIARRSLTLVALLCLVGASAFGAREALSGGKSNLTVVRQGPFVLAAAARSGPDSWSLRLYRREAELCRVLVVADTESSRCSPVPGMRSLELASVVSPLRRYVFGVTGENVARVSVSVGGSVQTVPTHVLDAARSRAGGLPPRVRWFLAVLDRPASSSNPPALVHALDAEGHVLGPTHASCVETSEREQCR